MLLEKTSSGIPCLPSAPHHQHGEQPEEVVHVPVVHVVADPPRRRAGLRDGLHDGHQRRRQVRACARVYKHRGGAGVEQLQQQLQQCSSRGVPAHRVFWGRRQRDAHPARWQQAAVLSTSSAWRRGPARCKDSGSQVRESPQQQARHWLVPAILQCTVAVLAP